MSSTVAVINQDEEDVDVDDDDDEVDGDQVMISDEDEGEEERDFDDEPDEDEEDDEDSPSDLYAHQQVNCFIGDQTEAYEAADQTSHDLQHHQHQQLHGCVDQQYHQFSQSDYVEAVEGFSPDQDEEDEDEDHVYSDEE